MTTTNATAAHALDEFRRAKDEFFARDPHSPLTEDQQRGFRGLAYYPLNPDLIIRAALEEPGDGDPGAVEMVTSDGEARTYRRVGWVRFAVDGRDVALTLFDSVAGHGLFLPFRDATSGRETYGAGRYLEVAPPEGGRVVVDFNYAYNPNCAYNEGWSCPLPPVENWLSLSGPASAASRPRGRPDAAPTGRRPCSPLDQTLTRPAYRLDARSLY